MILKDNINTVGFPTTAGTSFLKDYRPKTNAPLADLLFKQGAILFAKSTMHELALGSTSANPTFGYVKNPYDLSRIPGGSSGGTAAAVAARIVPAGLGSDTTGSIRMPLHFWVGRADAVGGLGPAAPHVPLPARPGRGSFLAEKYGLRRPLTDRARHGSKSDRAEGSGRRPNRRCAETTLAAS
jgi:hypothetical protein